MLRHTVDVEGAAPNVGCDAPPGPDVSVRFELVANRGERLLLVRLEYRHPLWAKDVLGVYEMTADTTHAMQHAVSFDVEDQDAAYAELNARAVALGGPLSRPRFR